MSKSVLITGCSTGIGFSLAQAFQKQGPTVFATARKPSALDSLSSLRNVHILALDVTSDTSVRNAFEQVRTTTGGRLDYLINNAGIGIDLPALDTSMDEAKRLFETNFWGTVRMCQVFAPLVIAAKGTIVNNGSVLGEMAMPYMSTSFKANVPTVVLPDSSLYKPVASKIEGISNGSNIKNPMASDVYAEAVVKDVIGGKTGQVWRGGDARLAKFAKSFFPQWLMDRIVISNGTGLDELKLEKK